MEHFKRIHIDSCPDKHLFILDLYFGLIDRDRLPPAAVGVKQVFKAMIPVVDSDVTHIDKWLYPAKDSPAWYICLARTRCSVGVFAGIYFLLTCLLDNVVKNCLSLFSHSLTTLFTTSIKLTPFSCNILKNGRQRHTHGNQESEISSRTY